MAELNREFYLGDGCYATFSQSNIRLRAPREHGDDLVFIDFAMLEQLVKTFRELGGTLT